MYAVIISLCVNLYSNTDGPEIVLGPVQQSAALYQPVSVLCGTNLRGHPTPRITWTDYFGNAVLNNPDEGRRLINDETGVRLNISSLNSTDGFFFTCTLTVEATNVTVENRTVEPYYLVGEIHHTIHLASTGNKCTPASKISKAKDYAI